MVCPKCGRVLVAGEICKCQIDAVMEKHAEDIQEEIERQEAEERAQIEKDIKADKKRQRTMEGMSNVKDVTANVSANVIQNILAILKTPVEGIVEFVEQENLVSAFILIIIQSLFIGLFSAAAISSLFGSLALLFTIKSKFIVGILFFLTSLIALIANGAGFFIVSKINKKSISIQQAICLCSVKAVFVVPLTLLATILVALQGTLGLGCFFFALIAGVGFDSIALKTINVEDNSQPYYLAIVYLITIVVTFIMISISSKIIFS